MLQRLFARTGLRLPVIGQGTWNMEQDRARSIAALRRGLELGMSHIDTAEMYGSGQVEEIVGEAIRGQRKSVFLATKVLPSNASRKGTVKACEASLRRLGTDWIDLYLLHWPGAHPLGETIAAFEELDRAGKIRAWGLSNFDERGLAEATDIAGEGRMTCDQVLYHLEERAIEHAVVPWCERHGVAVVGYSPFGSGSFPAPGSPGGRVLASVARRHGATPRQVALAFLVTNPVAFAIPKSSSVAHVEENAGAGALVLEPEDVSRLDAAFARGRPKAVLPTI